MPTAYFLSMCFYVEAICDDFDGVFHDFDNGIVNRNDPDEDILKNTVLLINLQRKAIQ